MGRLAPQTEYQPSESAAQTALSLLNAQYSAGQVPDHAYQHSQARARHLSRLGLPEAILAASHLIPALRRELMPLSELVARFGQPVTTLAETTTRLLYHEVADAKRRLPARAQNAERLRRLFACVYGDPEVGVLLAADRMASAERLRTLDPTEQGAWANETIAVHLPLLELLGLWDFRRELGNLSLQIVNPPYSRQFEKHVAQYRLRHQALFERVCDTLGARLKETGLGEGIISLHDSTPISLYQRMERARRRGGKFTPDEASLPVIDVIVPDVSACYLALGIVHHLWRPAHRHGSYADRRFYDYIAAPRYNGYRCLITTVICELERASPQADPEDATEVRAGQRLVEFRIRTAAMEAINMEGVAAALREKASSSARAPSGQDQPGSSWWNNDDVRAVVRHAPEPGAQLTQPTQPAQIAIFTPTGEVIYPVRKGSTMVDMAFRIHAQLGPFARRFWANGRQVSYDYVLSHRDLIEIEYDPQFPSLTTDWERIAVTSVARSRIHRYLRDADLTPQKGRARVEQALERECKIFGMRLSEARVDEALGRIAQKYQFPSVDALYLRVMEGEPTADEVVSGIIEAELVQHIEPESGPAWPATRMQLCRCWMQEPEARRHDPATRVLPGAPIVGRVMGTDKAAVLMVHRADCRNAPQDSSASAVALRWRTTEITREVAELTITAPPRSYVVGMVLRAIYDIHKDDERSGIIIHRVQSEMQEGSLWISLVIDAPSVDDLDKLQESLRAIQRGHYITEFRMWQLFPGQKLAFIGRSDRRRINPYTLRQVRDQSMFFGREAEIRQVIEYVQQGRSFVIVYGQKRIGKTSLLYHLAEHLLPESCNVLTVSFDAHSLAAFTPSAFLLGLADAAMRKLAGQIKHWDNRRGLQLRERDLAVEPYSRFAAWVKRVEERLDGKRILFMVDEFTRAEEECRRGALDRHFFDGLQYLVSSEDIGFILCIHDFVYREDSLSWEMLQRGEPVRLLSLERSAAARLVQQPIERHYRFPPDLVEAILNLTHCHPYFIQAICQALTTHMAQKDDDNITLDDLEQATTAVLVTGDHYFSHYRSLTDAASWDTLKILAFLTDDDHPWATSDEIREEMRRFGHERDRWAVAKSLNDLLHTEIIEARHSVPVSYRISVMMFRKWLRKVVTHPIVSRDIQRRE